MWRKPPCYLDLTAGREHVYHVNVQRWDTLEHLCIWKHPQQTQAASDASESVRRVSGALDVTCQDWR